MNDMAAPIVHTFTNGLRLVLAPCEAESVAFGIFVASGSRHETARTAGISHLIEHMLFKGTRKRRPIDITREIEGRGGNFNAFTGEESTCYYAHLPHEFLGEAVDIILDMYLNATIPDDEFKREKGVVLEEIKMYSDEPKTIRLDVDGAKEVTAADEELLTQIAAIEAQVFTDAWSLASIRSSAESPAT